MFMFMFLFMAMVIMYGMEFSIDGCYILTGWLDGLGYTDRDDQIESNSFLLFSMLTIVVRILSII